jgi:hypothetical protein
MSSLPFTEPQCFFIAILVFIVVGFQRGWKRELISLVGVLLGVFLIRSDSAQTFSQFLGRLPGVFSYLVTGGSTSTATTATPGLTAVGPWGSLFLFALVVAAGYYLGNRVFPKPATPAERFLGVVPAVISGAFVIGYVSAFVAISGQSQFSIVVQTPNPSSFVPVILVIAIVAVVIALIASRAKKPVKK